MMTLAELVTLVSSGNSLRIRTDSRLVEGGDIFVADSGNNLVRKVTADGTVSTVAGTGQRYNVRLDKVPGPD